MRNLTKFCDFPQNCNALLRYFGLPITIRVPIPQAAYRRKTHSHSACTQTSKNANDMRFSLLTVSLGSMTRNVLIDSTKLSYYISHAVPYFTRYAIAIACANTHCPGPYKTIPFCFCWARSFFSPSAAPGLIVEWNGRAWLCTRHVHKRRDNWDGFGNPFGYALLLCTHNTHMRMAWTSASGCVREFACSNGLGTPHPNKRACVFHQCRHYGPSEWKNG